MKTSKTVAINNEADETMLKSSLITGESEIELHQLNRQHTAVPEINAIQKHDLYKHLKDEEKKVLDDFHQHLILKFASNTEKVEEEIDMAQIQAMREKIRKSKHLKVICHHLELEVTHNIQKMHEDQHRQEHSLRLKIQADFDKDDPIRS